MGTEVELKLVTSRSALRKALALPWLGKMTGDTVKHQDLTSVYFDTPKLTLRDHGVSLRVRRAGANHNLESADQLRTLTLDLSAFSHRKRQE